MHRKYTPAEREIAFWAKVDKSGDCWIWTAGRFPSGYGCFASRPRKSCRAHRFAWELTNGPIPDGLLVCHRCDNPPCVRLDHLFLGTNQDNVADRHTKGRDAVGERNGNAKLTRRQVEDLRRVYRELRTPREILAVQFGISPAMVNNIVRGANWR